MPTDAELAAYAKDLPSIYVDILKAFPRVEPGRKAGYGLAVQTLAAHFANVRLGYALGEVIEASRRLEEKGFVEIKDKIFVHPTELGERLIAAITGGNPAPQVNLPPLPQLTW